MKTSSRLPLPALAGLALVAGTLPLSASGPADTPRDAFELQKARDEVVQAFTRKKFYDPSVFNLDDLPAYVPEVRVAGMIRIWGSDMFGGKDFKAAFEHGFQRHHPGVTFAYNLGGPSLAVGGLTIGECDVGIARRVSWELLLAYQRIHNCDPLEITGMTGWGVNPAFVIAVHRSNPINRLTMAQLADIYGAAHTGGWVGTTWHPERSRGPEQNIRRWGQLGVTGTLAGQTIHVYGFNLRYLYGPRFSDDVLEGSDQWNENLRQYANEVGPDGKLRNADQQMADDLAKDPAGIAYWSYGRAASPDIKLIALSTGDGAPACLATLETVREHRYPLFDRMFFYLDRRPGQPLSPLLREFMRYVLSRDAQALVAKDTTMLPLTAAMIDAERKKLD